MWTKKNQKQEKQEKPHQGELVSTGVDFPGKVTADPLELKNVSGDKKEQKQRD